MSFIPTRRILICYTSREWKHSRQFEKMAALSVDGMAWSWWKCNWQAVGVPWRTVRECLRKIQRKRIDKAKLKLIHEFSRKSPESGNHEPTSPSNINQITISRSWMLAAHTPFNPQTITNHRSLQAHIRNNSIPAPFNTPITRTLHKTFLPINYFYVSGSKSYP